MPQFGRSPLVLSAAALCVGLFAVAFPAASSAAGVPGRAAVRIAAAPPSSATLPAASGSDTIDQCLAPPALGCGTQLQKILFTVTVPSAPTGITVTYFDSNLPKGVTASFAPNPVKTYPYKSVETLKIAGDARITDQDTETVGADCGPTFVCLEAQAQFEVMCSLSAHHCPQLQLTDANQKSGVVSGNPPNPPPKTTSVVGYQADVTVKYQKGTGQPGTSYSEPTGLLWKVPGNPIAGYAHDGKPPQPFDASSLTSNEVKWYYYTGGEQKPSVTGTLTRTDNQEIAVPEALADYDVKVPANQGFTQTTGAFLGGGGKGTTYWTLGFRGLSPSSKGITFRFIDTDVPGFPGDVFGTQLIDYAYNVNGKLQPLTGGAFWLDNNQFYPELGGSGPNDYQSADSPNVELDPGCTNEGLIGSFKMYFMFKPNVHGIWVTLAKVDWFFQAGAHHTKNTPQTWCLNGNGSCPPTVPAAWSADPAVNPSTEFPLWAAVFKNPTSFSPCTKAALGAATFSRAR